jgi:hypothetical protein
MDKHDLNNYVDALEATNDADKMRAFVRMAPQDRATYLYHLRAYARSDEISLRRKATLLNVERKLSAIDREAKNAGR